MNMNPNQPTPTVQAAGECPACGGTGLTGIIADDGSGVKEPCPSCNASPSSAPVGGGWRDLLPDEVIQEGDECQFYEGMYSVPNPTMKGNRAGDYPLYGFRRRITQPDTAQASKWNHFAADVLADNSFSKYWNGLDADTRSGLMAILKPADKDTEAKARKVAEDLGPEIKSQAAQAEPALPRKAHVSQEAEECKVGAAILADLKVWLEFRLQTVEHQEPDRRPYPPTGHEQDSYSVVPIPEWETRQKLDAITAALLQFSEKDL